MDIERVNSYLSSMDKSAKDLIDTFFNINLQIDHEKVLWIQGPGGNTSVKFGDQLLVKASGTRIKDLRSPSQLAELHRLPLIKELKSFFHNNPEGDSELLYKNAIESNTATQSPRPSMESGFHAWLPQRFILHLHSIASMGLTNLITSSENLKAEFCDWYQSHWEKQLGPLAIIPFCLPGFQLTKSIAQTSPAALYFLKNHGVVIASDQAETLTLYKQFEIEACKKWSPSAWEYLQHWQHLSSLELIQNFPQLLTGSLKFYFPDWAILFSRIQKNIQIAPQDFDQYQFQIKATTTHNLKESTQPLASAPSAKHEALDIDALENWLATSMLQKAFPHLNEISSSYFEKLIQLPTEIARKKAMESQS